MSFHISFEISKNKLLYFYCQNNHIYRTIFMIIPNYHFSTSNEALLLEINIPDPFVGFSETLKTFWTTKRLECNEFFQREIWCMWRRGNKIRWLFYYVNEKWNRYKLRRLLIINLSHIEILVGHFSLRELRVKY